MPDVHPDRYSTSGVQPVKQGVALHTNEGGDGSYETLKWLLSLPGDRPIDRTQPNGRKYGSAYHALAKNNPAADYDQVLPASAGPFAGPPLSRRQGEGRRVPAPPDQRRARGADTPSAGGGGAHNNMQPWRAVTFIIRT